MAGRRRMLHHRIFILLFFIIVSVGLGSGTHDHSHGRRRVPHHPSAISQHPVLGFENHQVSSFRNHRQQRHERHHVFNDHQKLSPEPHDTDHIKRRSHSDRHNNARTRRLHRHTFGMPFVENLLRHSLHPLSSSNIFHPYRSSAFFTPFHQHHRNQDRWIEGLRTQMENHMERMSESLISPHHPKHLSPSYQHRQEPTYRLPSRFQHRVQQHNPYQKHNNFPSGHHQSLSKITEIKDRGRSYLYDHQNGGRHQYRFFKNSLDNSNGIPEDVEVFQRPLIPPPPITSTPPTFTPTIVSHGRGGEFPHDREDNCTSFPYGGPFHHAIFKSTSISHGNKNNNYSPVHSLGHQFTTSIITKGHRNPFQVTHSFQTANRHHQIPTKIPRQHHQHHRLNPNSGGKKFHPRSDTFEHPFKRVFDSLLPTFEKPSQSIVPSTVTRERASSPSFEAQDSRRYFKTNVEDHLNNFVPTNNNKWKHPGDSDAIPCIKCPPDTHVEAPRGTDCVSANPPSPLSCSPRGMPELRTVVTEGPPPGTLLPEGHYTMVITIMTSDASSTSTPITSCKVNYDVEVRKCPQLPEVEGAEVSCTAGHAWGSKCTWSCRGGRILHGSSVSTCTGHAHPRWSRPAPLCTDPPSKRPTQPRPTPYPSPVGTCPPPPEIDGGHIFCQIPSGQYPPPPPRPTPPPSSRRELIPKDEPVVSRSDQTSNADTRYASAALTLAVHPVGTICRVQCSHGRRLRTSENGRRRATLTCTPALMWDQRPPDCHLKVPPVLRPGDCEDTSVPYSPSSPSQLDALPLPTFLTASGDPAEVTCNTREMEPDLHYIRSCKAVDQELETSATCQYIIKGKMPGEPKCPDLVAPERGDLVCHEDDVGDLICMVICNEGFRPPFSFTRCSQKNSLWDFQGKEGDALPPCIPEELHQSPDGILKPFLPKTHAERPETPETRVVGTSTGSPKNTKFKTVADVFEGQGNHWIDVDSFDESDRKYLITDVEEKREDNGVGETEIHEDSNPLKGNENDFVYYYDALGENDEDADYYYEGLDESGDDYNYDEVYEEDPENEEIGDSVSLETSLTDTFGRPKINNVSIPISEFHSKTAYSIDDLEGRNKQEDNALVNSEDIGSGSTEVHFLDLDTMPKMMEEDISDLFPPFHGTPVHSGGDSFQYYEEENGEELMAGKETRRRNESVARVNDSGYLNNGRTNLEVPIIVSQEVSRNEEQIVRIHQERKRKGGKHALGKVNRKVSETTKENSSNKKHGENSQRSHQDRHINSWRQNEKTITKDSAHVRIDLEDDLREEKGMKEEEEVVVEEEGEAAIMEAALEMEMLVEECGRSNEAVEVLTKALMQQEECQKLTCNPPHTMCRNESSDEGVVSIVWVVGGSYHPLDDYYYYDDLQVPVVETDIDDLQVSTERLVSSEKITRALEVLGAAIDLTSFTRTHLDLLCKQPGYGFDPNTNRCRVNK